MTQQAQERSLKRSNRRETYPATAQGYELRAAGANLPRIYLRSIWST